MSKKISERQYTDACKEHVKAITATDKLNADMKAELDKVKAKYEDKIKDQEAKADSSFRTIHEYCEQNANVLFAEKRSISTGLGVTVGFRTSTPKLMYGEGVSKENLVWALQNKHMDQYLTVKVELDANHIKKSADGDKKLAKVLADVGVTIGSEETFFVKPD